MKLHFQRFEFKYILNWQEYQEIRAHLRRYVSVDEFACDAVGNFYEVISLYYDSPKFYYYCEKFDGTKDRKKFRLRVYRTDGVMMDNVFFEIKRKSDAVVLKDRFLMDRATCAAFMENSSFNKTSLMANKKLRPIIDEYEYERDLRSLRPQVLISYYREPYIGAFNNNFRLTFDYNIKAVQTTRLFDVASAVPLLADRVVMELKFNGKLPFYIREIIERYNLERVAFSKYGRGVEACHLLPDLNLSRHNFFNVDKNLLVDY